ncbi:MAG: hypothetical protein K2X59_13505 [Sphingomonas sp.]|nr:hypothetical protein [Sphingomonas sp.]
MIISLLLAGLIILQWGRPKAGISHIVDQAIWRPIAKRLMAVERRHLLFALLMIAVLLFAGELLAMGGPLDAGLIVLWDVSTYVDILLVSAMVGLSARIKVGWQMARRGIQQVVSGNRRLPRARARRLKRERPASNANDDDRHDMIRLAA